MEGGQSILLKRVFNFLCVLDLLTNACSRFKQAFGFLSVLLVINCCYTTLE
jgi:hypothetical protein